MNAIIWIVAILCATFLWFCQREEKANASGGDIDFSEEFAALRTLRDELESLKGGA
jgi:hypothetical protein